MTLKKVIQYVGTKYYSEDIANNLENCQQTTMSPPQHTPDMLQMHVIKVTLKQT